MNKTMNSRFIKALALSMLTSLVLLGCEMFGTNTPASTTPTVSVTIPTTADLVGTWKSTSSSTSTDSSGVVIASSTRTTTTTYGADGAYLESSVDINNPVTGTVYSYYFESRGEICQHRCRRSLTYFRLRNRIQNDLFRISINTGFSTAPTKGIKFTS